MIQMHCFLSFFNHFLVYSFYWCKYEVPLSVDLVSSVKAKLCGGIVHHITVLQGEDMEVDQGALQ